MATASGPGWVEEYVAVDAEQFADFIEHEVLDLEDLAEGAEIQRRRFNRMTPPGVSWVQPMVPSVAPFDADYFDDLFLSELLGEDKNSVAVFPLSLALDPQTRETLVYNADGLLIAVVPADPVVREWPEDADPARVTIQLDLLPMEDVEPYLYTERRIAEYNEAQTAEATKAGGTALRGLGSNEFGIAGIQRMSNDNMQITVSNGMDSAEVFAYTVWHTSSVSVVVWTNEYDEVLTNSHTAWHPVSPSFDGIESEWECLTTNLALVDGVGVFEDTAISPHARLRFYAVANPVDSDGDGLSDAAERLVYKTDPHNPDTDGDGVSDGVEVAMGSNPLNAASTPVLDDLDEALAQVNTAQIGYLSYLCGLPFAYDSSASYAQRISQLREMLDALLGSFLDLEVNTGGMLAERPAVVVWKLESVLTSIGSGSGNWLQGPVTTEQVEEIVAVLDKLTRLVSIGKRQRGHEHQPIAYHDGAVQVSNSWDLGTGLPERWPTNQPIQTCLLLGIKVAIPMVGSGTVDDWILVNNSARFPVTGSIYTQHIADISTVWNPDGTNSLALWDCGDCAGTNNYAYLSRFSLIHVLDVPVLKVELTNIKFNHDTTSSASDAINIRQDYSTPIDISHGEWIKGGANHPAAYTADNSVTIKARFTVQPDSITNADIWAVSTDSDGSLGDVVKRTVTFSGGISVGDANGYVEFSISENTPTVVKKTSTDTWQWKAENINGASVVCDFDVSGPHTVYTILGEPMSPWVNTFGNQRNAWVSALNFAVITCNATGSATEDDAMYAITTHLYTIPYTGASQFLTVDGIFCYSNYMMMSLANCLDSAVGLEATGCLLGVDIVARRKTKFFGYNFHCFVKRGDYVYDSCSAMSSVIIKMPYATYIAAGTPEQGSIENDETYPIE